MIKKYKVVCEHDIKKLVSTLNTEEDVRELISVVKTQERIPLFCAIFEEEH